MNHSTTTVVPEVDLMFRNNPMGHIHKEDPQEAAPTASVSSEAAFSR